MVVVRGRLEPEMGAMLVQALAAARETLYQRARAAAGTRPADSSGDLPTMGQRQADALGLLAEAALHQELDPGTSGDRYQVVVHVDAAVLAGPEQPGQSVLEEGSHVSAETSRRLACDASRVVMRHDEARAAGGSRGSHPDDSARLAAGAPSSGPRLSLPGLHGPRRAGPSSPPLGPGRPDHSVEPRAPLSSAPSRGPRGGLPGRARGRRSAPVPAARRSPAARRAVARRGARRCRRGSTSASRLGRSAASRRARRARAGSGSVWMWAGRSASCIPRALPVSSAYAHPSVSTALPGYLRAIRSAATWAISVHGRSTLMWGASWPAATMSARRRRPIAAGSLPSSVKR